MYTCLFRDDSCPLNLRKSCVLAALFLAIFYIVPSIVLLCHGFNFLSVFVLFVSIYFAGHCVWLTMGASAESLKMIVTWVIIQVLNILAYISAVVWFLITYSTLELRFILMLFIIFLQLASYLVLFWMGLSYLYFLNGYSFRRAPSVPTQA